MARIRKPTEPRNDAEIDRATLPAVKTAVTLSADAHYRLQVAGIHYRKTHSELLEALVMREYGGGFTSVRTANAVKMASDPGEEAA